MAGVDRRWWAWLGAITALGFLLRIAGAQGGLWLDEAWSVVQAHDAGTPLGVFLNINHDNNHHLNSVWLQLVGYDAAPWVARLFSVLLSTASIVVAGLMGRRRQPYLGLLTALMFALCPVMVTLGSEARGYAGMGLMFLLTILIADRWMSGESRDNPAVRLALCFFLGVFFQLTMLFGFCAVVGWVFFALWRRDGLRPALARSLHLFWPSLLAVTLALGIVFGAAAAQGGFKFGSYDPFTLLMFLHGVSELWQYMLGFPIVSLWWFVLVPTLVILAPSLGVSRIGFHRLAIIAFPVTLAALHAGNTGHPRYYLVSGIALLILIAEMLWLEMKGGGWRRFAAGGALTAILIASVAQDIDLAINRRGDPAAAVREMQARAPQGTRLTLERDTGRAMLQVGAAHARYPLTISLEECPPGRFLFVDRFRGETTPARLSRCGVHFTPILEMRARGMSGLHWTLYERRP